MSPALRLFYSAFFEGSIPTDSPRLVSFVLRVLCGYCKLACETKAARILQLSLSSELLERLSVRGRFKRQPHIKLCAIRTRAEVDFSVMPFDDDPVADNQAESRA